MKTPARPFAEHHALWSDAQHNAASQVLAQLERGDFDTVRFSFPDQHGILRGKTLVAAEAARTLRSGIGFTSTMYAKDTSHRSVFSVFTREGSLGFDDASADAVTGTASGTANTLLLADPTTFKSLPWSPRTGWVLCDAYMPDGRPVPYATRPILARANTRLAERGWQLVTGLEVEFHVFRVSDLHMQARDAGQPGTPVDVELLTHGYQYLTESRYDSVDALMQLLRETCEQLALPVNSLEIEFGPSQFEFTFAPQSAAASADTMLLFRSAVKQVCARHGYHATFMCRPRIPNVVSSGWHLHQSLVSIGGNGGNGGNGGGHAAGAKLDAGTNLFMPLRQDHLDGNIGGSPLSPLGMHFMGGLLKHAGASTPFATPTINGYKRFRSQSLAPDRACWAHDNRGAMLRVLGGVNDNATRIENRIGEPAANPYLYFASQIFAGLDGIDHQIDPGSSADQPYAAQTARLPTHLSAALDALDADEMYRKQFTDQFVDYFIHLKRAELERYQAEVSDWEQREYFNLM